MLKSFQQFDNKKIQFCIILIYILLVPGDVSGEETGGMELILYETGKATKPTSRKQKMTTSNGNNHPALGEEDSLCTSWGTGHKKGMA